MVRFKARKEKSRIHTPDGKSKSELVRVPFSEVPYPVIMEPN